jgi:hypothetical protein
MSKRKQGRPDGRGRSDGSRRTQFAPGNQAARARSERKSKSKPLPDNAIESFRRALYQPVHSTKNGKRRKIPYIVAFFQKMMADALLAPLRDKIRFYRELIALGIMDVEIYRQRVVRIAQKYCDDMYDRVMSQHVFIDTQGKAYKSAAFEGLLYKTAFDICCIECTCGTAERAFDEASEQVLAAAKAAQASLDEDEDDDDDDDEDEDEDEDETDGPADDER